MITSPVGRPRDLRLEASLTRSRSLGVSRTSLGGGKSVNLEPMRVAPAQLGAGDCQHGAAREYRADAGRVEMPAPTPTPPPHAEMALPESAPSSLIRLSARTGDSMRPWVASPTRRAGKVHRGTGGLQVGWICCTEQAPVPRLGARLCR